MFNYSRLSCLAPPGLKHVCNKRGGTSAGEVLKVSRHFRYEPCASNEMLVAICVEYECINSLNASQIYVPLPLIRGII